MNIRATQDLRRQGPWLAPVYFHSAGAETRVSRSYRHDVSQSQGSAPRRVLLKYSLRGEGVLYDGDKRLLVPSGHAFLIERPGDYVYAYEGKGEPWEYAYFSMYFSSEGPLLPWHIRQMPVVDLRTLPAFADAMKDLVTGFRQGTQAELQQSAAAYALYTQCIAQSQAPQHSHSRAVQLREILQVRYTEDISIAECAHELQMSHEALTRKFKQEFSISPLQYVQHLRLRRAQRLLLSTHMSLVEIATDCGFTTANYFGRCFRAQFQQTPKQYRLSSG
ncbi:MAG: helix-turn-helix transcriptional regulator [Planctomycetes bacterium]|nr:helix-turn-helix transcriptional regulator [Planctomycetota bacterium]